MTKILYVEDNEDNIYMLSKRLARKGYKVIVATDGEQGVDLARSEAPALILMDLSVPLCDVRGRKPSGRGETAPCIEG